MSRQVKFSLMVQHEETGSISDLRYDYAEVFSGRAKRELEEKYPRWYVIARREFTGLCDRNGKEIYEGDLARRIHYKPDGSPNGSIDTKEIEWSGNGWNIRNGDRLEIVGNVYEGGDA